MKLEQKINLYKYNCDCLKKRIHELCYYGTGETITNLLEDLNFRGVVIYNSELFYQHREVFYKYAKMYKYYQSLINERNRRDNYFEEEHKKLNQ